jgi:hypothetical protein
VQNKEPAHFIAIFGGQLIIFMGGHKSGFRSAKAAQTVNTDPNGRLFQIRNNRIVQVGVDTNYTSCMI